MQVDDLVARCTAAAPEEDSMGAVRGEEALDECCC